MHACLHGNPSDMKCTHDFNPEHRDGRYFRFGVREFGMAAIVNGLFGMKRKSVGVG